MIKLTANAQRVLRVFSAFGAKDLPINSIAPRSGLVGQELSEALGELIHHQLVSYDDRPSNNRYRLTYEGWVMLGSPASIVFHDVE